MALDRDLLGCRTKPKASASESRAALPRAGRLRNLSADDLRAANQRTTSRCSPTYLFVRIVNRWYSIDNTIGVLQLLLSGDLPAKLRDDVIAELKRKERNGVVYLPKPRGLQLGDKVRILRGSFVDHIGLYDGMTGHERRVVLLELLGRKVRVELPSSQYLRPI